MFRLTVRDPRPPSLANRIVTRGTVMRTFTITCLSALLLAAAAPAQAVKYKCDCYFDDKAAVEAEEKWTMECVDTFRDYNSSVAVQEQYVKIKVQSKDLISGNNRVDFRVRPRNGYCIKRVEDKDTGDNLIYSSEWYGLCDDDRWLTASDLKLAEYDSAAPNTRTGRFEIYANSFDSVSNRDYLGLLYYTRRDDRNYLSAACIQNR